MLRITRLHLVLAIIGVACVSMGAYNWFKVHKIQLLPAKPPIPAPATVATVAPVVTPVQPNVARTIAAVGEAYELLRRQFGDIPAISQPLRTAKQAFAAGDTATAMASARDSWQALKMYRGKVADYSADTYQVARGDTLWRIAAAHSPAKAGAGWVTIWKANKTVVKDFNRIEIGWTLIIPPKPTQYVMPFWKPLGIN